MWWRTRHGRGPPARHHLLEQLPGPAEHPCRVPLAAAHTLAPLLSHVLVPTPTNVAGRSPSNNQVMHKTPGHTRRRPHSRGAAPISLGEPILHRGLSDRFWLQPQSLVLFSTQPRVGPRRACTRTGQVSLEPLYTGQLLNR